MLPGIDPRLAAESSRGLDIASSKEAPERHGVASWLEDGDRIAIDRARLELRLSFSANRIAILGHDDRVADAVDNPMRGQGYRWEVQPGRCSREVDRQCQGPDVDRLFLAPEGRLLIEVRPGSESAPIP